MLFIKILLTEFIAEMGDKTQLMLVALTSKFKVRDIVIGTAIAVLVLNGLAVLAGGLVGSLIPAWLIKIIAALAFLYFAATSLVKDEEEEEADTKGKFKFAPLTIFCTFFIAELGDKTQLTAMTFGANEGLSNALIVWVACSIGLFAADMIGMAAGILMKSKMPEGALNTVAFVIFTLFGILTLRQGLLLTETINNTICYTLVSLITLIFALICIYLYKRNKSTAN